MECEFKTKKMVATLQSRKEALEAKLKEKTVELKKLCIQEAELTGVLPPETPLEPGESPPIFRRRVGTAFSYPENLIDKLKSKEEESLAKLELECKIQMSIAEAALGLANDDNSNKSIRRKHRLMYQQSQKRLAELETRLNILRQNMRSNQLKHRKKPRPPLNSESDCVDGLVSALRETQNGTCVKNSYCQTDEVADAPFSSFVSGRDIRSTAMYNSFGKASYYNNSNNGPSSTLPNYLRQNNNGQTASGKYNWNYRLSSPPPQEHRIPQHHHHHSAITLCGRENRNWVDDSLCDNIVAPPLSYYSNQFYSVAATACSGTVPVIGTNEKSSSTRMKSSRYGSLDRRRVNSHLNHNYEHDHQSYYHQHYNGNNRYSQYPSPAPQPNVPAQLSTNCNVATAVRHQQQAEPASVRTIHQNVVLLPNQTYPENSLMRTQSLGNVEQPRKPPDTYSLGSSRINNENSFQSSTLGRKSKEKEWRETSLDCSSSSSPSRNQTPPLYPKGCKLATPPTCLPHNSPVSSSSPLTRYSVNTPPPLPPPPQSTADKPCSPDERVNRSPIKSPTLIDTCVPFESPKNHTVVEVGKWQPYREVSKPFEMSDFYKYSTKFRKNIANTSSDSNGNTSNNEIPESKTNHSFSEKMFIANRV